MFNNEPLVTFNQESNKSPLIKAAEVSAGTIAFLQLHRLAMRKIPNLGEKAYNFFHTVEERSPGKILRTFSLGELYSSYLPKQVAIRHEDLFVGTDFSAMGEHLQRMLGTHYDLRSVEPGKTLRFIRSESGSAYMNLEGAKHIGVRFFKVEQVGGKTSPGRILSSSQRLGAPIEEPPFSWARPKTIRQKFLYRTENLTPFGKVKRVLHNIGEAQLPTATYRNILDEGFQPGSVRVAGELVENVKNSAQQFGFLMGERAQVLLSDIRLGLWKGSYNSLLHVPFSNGGKKGLINEILSKRVLPIYLGVVGLGYADYLTHHIVSDTLIDFYQKSRVAHAKVTDELPGAREITDKYENLVPGKQYGPLALPLLGTTTGAVYHYSKVVAGKFDDKTRSLSARVFARKARLIPFQEADEALLGIFNRKSPIAKGLVVGLAAMLPFVPGMLGSRQTARELQDIYSGDEPVPIRSGRWWDLGTTPWEGNRIKEYRPHWSVLARSHAEETSLYGSEKEYWAHHPILHPLRWLKDPYWLEKQHYEDRPYPITSPAFSNVPLIGPLLAATIGKVIKPPIRMHSEWSGEEYHLGSSRLDPRGPNALPPAPLKQEFDIKDTVKREALQFSELIGLPGFIIRTLYGDTFPTQTPGKDVYMQGSRMMESISRRYYEKELGAGIAPNMDLTKELGYTEPLRRFIQPEPKRFEANEIRNTMPSWLPGEDYFLNFRVGDPYAKISEGYARLPGKGYEALHPEIADTESENYPDIVKMSILGDVAPYSVEYREAEARVRKLTTGNPELQIEYDKIVQRVKAMKESVVRTDDRRFSKEVVQTKGTIKVVTGKGIELSEYPGRVFSLSSTGHSAADQSALVLAEHNDWSKAQVATEVAERQRRLSEFLDNTLQPGTEVSVTTPLGALESQTDIRAVFETKDLNVNKALLNEGLAQYRKDLAGPESQALFGKFEKLVGRISEEVSFTGDEARWNPLRYVPSPYHTKFWQERTALAQYQQEMEGARLRRWQHPVEDFLMPYARGIYRRLVGDPGPSNVNQEQRDLNTLTDMLEYIRDMKIAGSDSTQHGRYTSQARRTAIGADLFGSPSFIATTFSGRDSAYYQKFLKESDPKERQSILKSVPKEMARALSSQWVSQQAKIAEAEGTKVPALGEDGRLYTNEELDQYSKADTKLNYGDYQRSKEIAEFFVSQGLNLPEDVSSPLYDPNIDYEDVKLKIIQQEGYDLHDFGLFDDRAAVLWRKPYIDGAIRELTGPDRKSVEQVRRSVEEMILATGDKNSKVMITSTQANKSRGNVRVDIDLDQQKQILQDMRRNPEAYQ